MADDTDRTPDENTAGRAGPSRREADAAVAAEDRRAQASGDRKAPLDAREERRSPAVLAGVVVVLLIVVALIAWLF